MANRYRVQATFPELPAAIAEQATTVESRTWRGAITMAERQFSSKLKRRRITTVELRVVKLPNDDKE